MICKDLVQAIRKGLNGCQGQTAASARGQHG